MSTRPGVPSSARSADPSALPPLIAPYWTSGVALGDVGRVYYLETDGTLAATEDLYLDQVFTRSKTIYMKAINDTVSLLRLLMKEPVADSSHLARLIQIVSFLNSI